MLYFDTNTRAPFGAWFSSSAGLPALCMVVGKMAGSDSMAVLHGHCIYRSASKRGRAVEELATISRIFLLEMTRHQGFPQAAGNSVCSGNDHDL